LFGDHWQVVQLGARAGLILTKMTPFNGAMWPYYQRRGHRSNDKGFHDDGAWTHVFMPSLHPLKTLALSRDAFHDAFTHISLWPSPSSQSSLQWKVQKSMVVYLGNRLLERSGHPLALTRQRLQLSLQCEHKGSEIVKSWTDSPSLPSSSYTLGAITNVVSMSTRQPFPFDIVSTNNDAKTSAASQSLPISSTTNGIRVDMRRSLWSSIITAGNVHEVSGDVFQRHVLTPHIKVASSPVAVQDTWPCYGSRLPLPVHHESEAVWMLATPLPFSDANTAAYTQLVKWVQTVIKPVIGCDMSLTPSSATCDTPLPSSTSSSTGSDIPRYSNAIMVGTSPVVCRTSLVSSQQYTSSHTLLYAGYIYGNSCANIIGYWYRVSLDALTLVAFGIGEDHRILWSDDERFVDQYQSYAASSSQMASSDEKSKWPPSMHLPWQPHSLFPAAHGHHVSFWLPLLDKGNGNHEYPLPMSIAKQSLHDTSIKTPDPNKEKPLVDEDALGTGRTAASLPLSTIPTSSPLSSSDGSPNDDKSSSTTVTAATSIGVDRAAWTAERRARKLERRAIMSRQSVGGNGAAARAARLGGMSSSNVILPDGIANSVARATAAKQRRAAKAAAEAEAATIVAITITPSPVISSTINATTTTVKAAVTEDDVNALSSIIHFGDDDTTTATADTTSNDTVKQTGARRAARKAKSAATRAAKAPRQPQKAVSVPLIDNEKKEEVKQSTPASQSVPLEEAPSVTTTGTDGSLISSSLPASLLDRDRTAMSTAANTVSAINDGSYQSLVIAFERPLVDLIRNVAGPLVSFIIVFAY
jgi:hypothetical protein